MIRPDMVQIVPYLPDSAPFSAEQRAWLNRFLEEITLAPASAAYGRDHPFSAPLLVCKRLNGPGSSKETRHVELSLAGSGLSYEAGDALGVVPENCPGLANALLEELGFSGQEPVHVRGDVELPLSEAMLTRLDVTTPSTALLAWLATSSGSAPLSDLLHPEHRERLARYIESRDVLDLLREFPSARWSPESFTSALRPLQPRLYSISSSPKVHAGQVHLTIGVVRYHMRGRDRKGVCSTHVSDRTEPGNQLPVFVQRNARFRLPKDPAAPIIMIGPGTGIAPFRGFLHERRATGGGGPSWLFFGDQHAASDFLYREELEAMLAEGTLARLDTAFSRDQAEKVYVQHRMIDHARALYEWLEEGAYFYVCGDAHRMARDVDDALHDVVRQASGRSTDASAEYVRGLKRDGRYLRDVY